MGRRPHPSPDTIWLKTSEAAKRARCAEGTLWRAAQSGRLRVAKIGRNLRFRPEWIDAWLEASTTPIEITPPQGGR